MSRGDHFFHPFVFNQRNVYVDDTNCPCCHIVLGAQQYTTKDGKKVTAGAFRDSIKHDFRSPSYTTKWSDIPEAR